MAGLLNNAISTQLTQWFPNSALLKTWEPSIAPPLVEESLKFGLALVIIYLSRTKSIWSALGIGLGVGLGFELSEDYTYTLSTMLTPSGHPIPEAISRLESIIASHWLLTALMTTAVLLLYWKQSSAKSLLLYALAPLVLHILWNSSFGENLLFKVALTIVSWIICISLYITQIKTIDTKIPQTP
ncbi:PrsW family glutamic-type intramembrane protease [Streptococcus caprae]|uniref:PrsW family glutamic-type intramembrane protease n=1 Tax=Streptococcus caprae TaxID=1640501 RepID=A0ABV8CWG7_9STRE